MMELVIGGESIPTRHAGGPFGRARGHMFRRRPPEHALCFEYPTRGRRGFHMAFVPFPLDIAFVTDGVVTAVDRMRPWIGHSAGECDCAIELPAGEYEIEPGAPVAFAGGDRNG